MKNFFRRAIETARQGLSDGFKEGMGIRHRADSDYNRLSDLNNDSKRSDDEVWLEFKIYCKKYDPKLEDHNTQAMMERILEQRPMLKANLLKDRKE